MFGTRQDKMAMNEWNSITATKIQSFQTNSPVVAVFFVFMYVNTVNHV